VQIASLESLAHVGRKRLPYPLRDIVDTHIRQLAYSAEKLAHLVALIPAELEATYGIGTVGRGDTRGRLRVVHSFAA
jgi:hypothetical protein